MVLEVGNIVEGVVTGIANFGAFVTLPGGQTGLVHISEVADAYVKDIKDYLKENDRTKVKIISLDKNGKIGLSIRQVTSSGPRRRGRRSRRQSSMSFEDKLAKFLKESDERQSDLKRSADEKRGGRGGGRRSYDNARAK
ncbi:MAG TPA: S1 RNA-binding domain-containing protein [Firmicutes bacterium]|nr:S1 RNA-binding domain-containing protein [Bacillota bacterium]